MFVSFSPLIRDNVTGTSHKHVLNVLWDLLLALLICSSILLAEKLLIQWIASRFNRRAYADRVENQEWAVYVLSRLCEVVGWENLEEHEPNDTRPNANAAAQKVKNVTFGAVNKAKTAVNAFANELSGRYARLLLFGDAGLTGNYSYVVEQKSPELMVLQHLCTEEKARAVSVYNICHGLKAPD